MLPIVNIHRLLAPSREGRRKGIGLLSTSSRSLVSDVLSTASISSRIFNLTSDYQLTISTTPRRPLLSESHRLRVFH